MIYYNENCILWILIPRRRSMEKKYIECGKIINTHGCHGGLKLESWCDEPEVLADFKRVFLKKKLCKMKSLLD